MKEKQLRRLSRAELLELLLEQTKENERLQAQVESLTAALAEKQLQISQAGNLAQAVLVVNRVARAAQNAADQYLENIKAMEQETKEKCQKLLQEAQQKVNHQWTGEGHEADQAPRLGGSGTGAETGTVQT